VSADAARPSPWAGRGAAALGRALLRLRLGRCLTLEALVSLTGRDKAPGAQREAAVLLAWPIGPQARQ